MDRKSAVVAVLNFERPVGELREQLSSFPWDCDEPLAKLLPEHLAAVLQRFLNGDLSAADVGAWASTIECRDDVEYDPKTVVGCCLHELAVPALYGPVSAAAAASWLSQLSHVAA